MARIRSVKPELRTSEIVASWPFEVRYFFVLLWGYLDDKGRGLDIPKQIAGDCFPYDDDVTAAMVDSWLDLMTAPFRGRPGPVCRYEVDGRRYLHTVNSGEHQKPNRPTPSRLPLCPIHERLTESSSESLAQSDSDGPPVPKQQVSPLTESLTEPPDGYSVPGIRQQRSLTAGEMELGAGEQHARGVSGPHAVDAKRLVQQHIPAEIGSAVRTALAIKVAELAAEFDEATLAEALDLWRGRTNVGPGVLPSLVADVVKRRNGHARAAPATSTTTAKSPTTDARMAAAQALKRPEPDNRRALPAGANP